MRSTTAEFHLENSAHGKTAIFEGAKSFTQSGFGGAALSMSNPDFQALKCSFFHLKVAQSDLSKFAEKHKAQRPQVTAVSLLKNEAWSCGGSE